MGIQVTARLDREAAVEISHERGQESITRFPGRDVSQPQFFGQAVLQGLDGPFDPSLGLWGMGTDDLNVELLHGASELGQSWRGSAGGLIDPENAVFVAVECEWLAMSLNIRSGGLSVAEEALTLHKGQLSQPAGRIIDKDQ